MAVAGDRPAEQSREHGALARDQPLVGQAGVARVQPYLEPECIELGHEARAARGVRLRRGPVVRVAVRGKHEAGRAEAVALLARGEAAVRPVGIAAEQAVPGRSHQAGGLDPHTLRVSGGQGALEAGAGAAAGLSGLQRQGVSMSCVSATAKQHEVRVGGRGLDAERRRGLAQGEHDGVERRRADLGASRLTRGSGRARLRRHPAPPNAPAWPRLLRRYHAGSSVSAGPPSAIVRPAAAQSSSATQRTCA